ncbi:hypothetical protein Acr_00g0088400 [Actinidia rufa]|uniref:Uncharacterized protein n=1 Tax=Actinidia rufa TaxID=165716 RepID=A0A7J0DWE2_9ERIC|nr:hypothetical protein Acr_00g0088400 [Actinidia rufa]
MNASCITTTSTRTIHGVLYRLPFAALPSLLLRVSDPFAHAAPTHRRIGAPLPLGHSIETCSGREGQAQRGGRRTRTEKWQRQCDSEGQEHWKGEVEKRKCAMLLTSMTQN